MKGELSLEFSETDHLPVDLIPQPQFDGFEAVKEAELGCLLEEGVREVTSLEVVVWNHRIEVVNVVIADVAREPLENFWKVVVAAAFHRCCRVVPLFAGSPVRIFELVLHVKQPETETSGYRHHDELNEKPGTKAVNHAHTNEPTCKGGVHDVDGLFLFFLGFGIREALKDNKQDNGCKHKQDEGVAYEPVAQLQSAR